MMNKKKLKKNDQKEGKRGRGKRRCRDRESNEKDYKMISGSLCIRPTHSQGLIYVFEPNS